MRRDLVRFYQADVISVFNAYATAVRNGLGKNFTFGAYHTIQYSLNFSFKYNMNGGSCTLHFIPYANGTAVDSRYSIAQLAGARYGAHEQYVANMVQGMLRIPGILTAIPIEMFTDERNHIIFGVNDNSANGIANAQMQPTNGIANAQMQPVNGIANAQMQPENGIGNVQMQQPNEIASQPSVSQATPKFCMNCGTRLSEGMKFCSNCGSKIM